MTGELDRSGEKVVDVAEVQSLPSSSVPPSEAQESGLSRWYLQQWETLLDNYTRLNADAHQQYPGLGFLDNFPYLTLLSNRYEQISRWAARESIRISKGSWKLRQCRNVIFLATGCTDCSTRFCQVDLRKSTSRPDLTEIVDRTFSRAPTVVLLPDLTPIELEVLGSLKLDPRFLELQLRRCEAPSRFNQRGQEFRVSEQSFDVTAEDAAFAFNYESDFWVHDHRAANFYTPKSVQMTSQPWPKLLTFIELGQSKSSMRQWKEDKYFHFRSLRRTTIQCQRSEDGSLKVVILLAPATRQIASILGIVSQEMVRKNIPGFTGIIELGHRSINSPVKPEVHLDGDPLLGSFILDGSQPSMAAIDERLRALSNELAQVVWNSSDSPRDALNAVLRYMWPRVSSGMFATCVRDTTRLANLRNLRQFSMFPTTHWTIDHGDVLEALEFLEDRIWTQLEMLTDYETRLLKTAPLPTATQAISPDQEIAHIRNDIAGLRLKLKDLLDQCAYQRNPIALDESRKMTALQIRETQKSLNQADMVGKLTVLAFFFIPISAVTSGFGMNLREIQEHTPPVSSFVAAVVVVTIVSMLIACTPMLRDIDAAIMHGFLDASVNLHEWLGLAKESILPSQKHSDGSPSRKEARRRAFNSLWWNIRWKPRQAFEIACYVGYAYILTGLPRLVFWPFIRPSRALSAWQKEGQQLRAEMKEGGSSAHHHHHPHRPSLFGGDSRHVSRAGTGLT